jgi:hypothetical protein
MVYSEDNPADLDIKGKGLAQPQRSNRSDKQSEIAALAKAELKPGSDTEPAETKPSNASYQRGYEDAISAHTATGFERNVWEAIKNRMSTRPKVPPNPPPPSHVLSAITLFVTRKAGEWHSMGYLDALLKIQKDEAQTEILAHTYVRAERLGFLRNRYFGDEEHDCGLFDAFCQMATTDEGREEVHGIWKRMNEIRAERAGLRFEDRKLWEEILRILWESQAREVGAGGWR